MADRVRDQAPDGRDERDLPDMQQPKQADRAPDEGPAPAERLKAEIAAGDVADDLADFA